MSTVKISYYQKPKDRNISSSRALNHPHEVQRSQQAEDPVEVRTLQANKKVMTSLKKNSSSVYQEIEFLNSFFKHIKKLRLSENFFNTFIKSKKLRSEMVR